MKAFVGIIIILVMAAGCAAPDTKLSDIFHYNFYIINPPTGTLSFEDEDLKFTFTPERDDIKISFVNKSTRPVKINWEGAVYVDKDGASHRLITKKVAYEDKDKPQKPTVITPGARLTERVMPADHIRHVLLIWKVKPMFPELKNAFRIEKWDRVTFKVILPIEVDGEEKRYEFEFKVKTR